MSNERIAAFQGPLWEEARNLLAGTKPTGSGPLPGADAARLTAAEYNGLVRRAAADGSISDQERTLLRILGDRENVRQIAEALRSGAFDPNALTLTGGHDTSRPPDELMAMATGARTIHATEARYATVDRAAIRRTAEGIRIGPGGEASLSTLAGQERILEHLGQLVAHGDEPRDSCVATSLTALGVARGPAGVAAVARVALAEDPRNAAAARILRCIQTGDTFTVADLSDMARDLYVSLNRQERNGHERLTGLGDAIIDTVLARHRDTLAPLFERASYMMTVDTDGDLASNHMVAIISQPGGRLVVFDPWETRDQGHLMTSPEQVHAYQAAARRSFTIADR